MAGASGSWGNSGVFWKGANGQVYVKGNKGTNAAGAWDGNSTKYWADRGFALIEDPNPPKVGDDIQQARQTAPTGGDGGGGSAPAPRPDRSNSIQLNLAGIGSLDSSFRANGAAIDSQYNTVMADYDVETGQAKTRYDDNIVTNDQNYQKNYQTSLVNAAKGRQGLFGSLAKIGALNGDGIVLANRAIKDTANEDVSLSEDTRDANTGMLNEKWADFKTEDDQRRKDAKVAADNAKLANRGNTAKTRQEYYTKLSNDYAEMGDAGKAKEYANLASGLFSEVALASTPNAGITRQSAAFTPTTLADIQPGSDMSVEIQPAQPGQGGIPGLAAGPKKKKETVTV